MGAALSYGESSEESACSRQTEEGTASKQFISTQVQTDAENVDHHEGENNHLKEENSLLRQEVLNCKFKINSMGLELQEQKERLSACLSAQLSSDERYLENVGETVRPSTLGKRYQELESTEWVSAKDQIDKNQSISSCDALKLLCFLMDEVYIAAGPEVMKREGELSDMMLRPVQYHLKGVSDLQSEMDPKGRLPPVVSETLKNEIRKCMKKTSHFIDLSGIEENVKVRAAEKFSLKKGFFVNNDELAGFYRKSAKHMPTILE
ncbi:hypothetical protein Bbelb_133600 [Branchiostoma belcheri]|nr:hypothetical protein Bbelb_133600 [Branchiostoma belcheri]